MWWLCCRHSSGLAAAAVAVVLVLALQGSWLCPCGMASRTRSPEYGELAVCGGVYTVFPGCSPLLLYRQYCKLNSGQKEAVRKVLVSDDYTLLLGLPGTGKTATLSLIVRALVARGERVLLTSYTHSAVDNLMVKLIDEGVHPTFALRLGAPGSVHPAVHPYLLDDDGGGAVEATVRDAASRTLSADTSSGTDTGAGAGAGAGDKPKTVANVGNLSALRSRCHSANIVACTVLTAPRNKVVRYMSRGRRRDEHAAFVATAQPGRAGAGAGAGAMQQQQQQGAAGAEVEGEGGPDLSFGYCIIDEAGQISQPAALGPLMHARKFMLVGDDYQHHRWC